MEPAMTFVLRPRPPPRRLARAALAALLLGACTPGGGGLSGTYEAKDPSLTMTLEFKSGGKVQMTMQQAGGQPDVTEADFMVNGNQVTVQVPGGMPLVLTRNGKTLDGRTMGQIMHFNKK